ncbi:MAG: ABC transporter permease [bacterium]
MSFLISILEQIILFLPLTFGIYISYVILQTTDITVDGSFVLGACVFAALINIGFSSILATLGAIIIGALAGTFVSFISRRNKISPLIASILVLFMLQSINLQIMGRPNISIARERTLYAKLTSMFPVYAEHIIIFLCVLCVALVLLFLLATRLGLFLRACGINRILFARLGKNPEYYRCFGLTLSNALAALCGVLTAQVNGYADISMGFGMALIGIGTVTFGQHILKLFYANSNKFRSPLMGLLGCLVGSAVYFTALNMLLLFGIDPVNLKLFLGLGLIMFLHVAQKTGGNTHE